MPSFVVFQIALRVEGLATPWCCADEGWLCLVDALVHLKVAALTEGLLAARKLALEGLGSFVKVHVGPQPAFTHKSATTSVYRAAMQFTLELSPLVLDCSIFATWSVIFAKFDS